MDNVKADDLTMATILNELEATINSATRVPLTGKVLVDGNLIINYIDQIYAALPEQLKRAQKMLDRKGEMMERAEDESKRILEEANVQAEAMTKETEIYRAATQRARDMLATAEQASIKLRHESIHYCDDSLGQLEEKLEEMLESIRGNREDLKTFRYYYLEEDQEDEEILPEE